MPKPASYRNDRRENWKPPARNSTLWPASSEALLHPSDCALLNNRVVKYGGQMSALVQGTAYFAIVWVITTLCWIPLAFYAVVLLSFGVVQAMQGSVIVGGLLTVIPLNVIFYFIGGEEPRRRLRRSYDLVRYLGLGLNLGVFHHWFIMNRRVACSLAEKVASRAPE